ncbi:GtrA family protein [Embleya sp. NBC_00896]|uniref:GtrA family protein n=1 Tax=Embleya sp. NBC_00896 TaxID=2975961 RepID=UPI002F90D530|nr:GtrA family protein [Embleya sp. NBC_00896]
MLASLLKIIRNRASEVSKFAIVGGVGYTVDVVTFNVLRSLLGVPALPAKVISLTMATSAAYLGNRRWTYRERLEAGTADARRQYLLFVGWSCGGMAIQIACLSVSRFVFGFDSLLADNISGNLIGMGFATAFRFWAYRTRVFRPPGETPAAKSLVTADQAPLREAA